MANKDLFTSKLPTLKEKRLGKDILFALKELKNICINQQLEIRQFNDNHVAIPIEIRVNLPTRGTINNIDIRKVEPIFLLFHIEKYPYTAPSVWSNRLDFPKDVLPHLNPVPKGHPANFCLYRGNIHVWFIEHSLSELVNKAKSWLEDAASGNLMRDSDQFEVTRIDEKYGYNVFNYDEFVRIVEDEWKLAKGTEGFTFLQYRRLNSTNDPSINTSKYSISFEGKSLIDVEYYKEINKALDACNNYPHLQLLISETRHRMLGLLIWPHSSLICNNYFASLPTKLSELIDFSNKIGIDVEKPISEYFSRGYCLFKEIPLTIAILRPQKIIGFNSKIEFLSFLLKLPEGATGTDNLEELGDKTPIEVLGHRNPLTVNLAKTISGLEDDYECGNILFLGCGAMGSKMILHFAKNGLTKCSIIDNDMVSPHNIVRFGLHHESLGWNKADAMSRTIKGIFYSDSPSVKIETIEKDAIDIFQNKEELLLNKYEWIIDTTASPLINHLITLAKVPHSTHCCRCEIAYSGKLGMMFIEGKNRKPRLDDLRAMIFDMAIENKEISAWLQANRNEREHGFGSRLQEISIGVSCSSETMHIPDELVSLHSAMFTSGFKKISKNNDFDQGYIQVNYFDESETNFFSSNIFEISSTVELQCRNDHSWKIRLCSNCEYELKKLFHSSTPSETGGMLVGFINFNIQTIYITRVLPAPHDSISSPYIFKRGISDVPEQIEQIQDKTGAMLGYVGEWHTHPNGGPQLSLQDLSSAAKIKEKLDKVPMPTLIMIVTERGIYSYINPT